MDYPYKINFTVNHFWDEQDIELAIYSGLTIFVGTNASGKTQALKALRDRLKKMIGPYKVRYLSSNRLGTMETYRSRTDQYNHPSEGYSFGDQNTKKARLQIETASGDFFAMDEKKDILIKVSERMSVMFDRNFYIRWDAGQMKVFFEKKDNLQEYPIADEASGLVNVISILAALYDDSVEVLLIDEPEVSLHPQLQSYLLREIKEVARLYNKTIIISTHSAEMITLERASDLPNYVFFISGKLPLQISPYSEELRSRKIEEFLLRMSHIYRGGFFAKKILLIEGYSDLIICRFLCNRLNLNLDIASSQIIPVEGKGQFAAVVKLFRLIGKEICVLTDLDGFIDDNSVIELFTNLPEAKELANKQGSADLQSMVRDLKTSIDNIVNANMGNMVDIYSHHPYWKNKSECDDEKSVKRAVVALLLSSSDDELVEWPNSSEWKGIKTRIEVLFGLLEQLGCFILKRGAMESYYYFTSNEVYDGKPIAAANEVNKLCVLQDDMIEKQFGDIVRALKYAAMDKTVDESFAVKKELLSELALILGVINRYSTEEELTSCIKQARGSSSSIFKYRIIKEGERVGVEVKLESNIISVKGFPLKAFAGDNVNKIVDETVHNSIIS